MQMIFHDAADGIGLDKVSSDNLDHHEKCTQGSENGSMETITDIVHGTAGISAILIFYPVKKAEDNFSIFGCHTDKSCNSHPENSPEASGENCGRDSYDIAAADTGSYGGAQSLKG